MKNRLKKSSVSLIAILLMVILIVLPTGYEDAVIFKGTDKIKAKVVSTDESTVKSSGSDPVRRAVLSGGASWRQIQRGDNQSSKYAQRLSGI